MLTYETIREYYEEDSLCVTVEIYVAPLMKKIEELEMSLSEERALHMIDIDEFKHEIAKAHEALAKKTGWVP